MLGVEKRLPEGRDHTHERSGIGRTIRRGIGIEGRVLKNVRAQNGPVRIGVAKQRKRARSTQHALVRNEVRRRETRLAQGGTLLLRRRQGIGHAELGMHHRQFVARTGGAGVRFTAGHAEEIDAAGGEVFALTDKRLAARGIYGLAADRHVKIDESGIDGGVRQFPDTRIGGDGNSGSHGLDPAVTNDDDAIGDLLAGLGNHLGRRDRVHPRRQGTMAGGKELGRTIRAENRQQYAEVEHKRGECLANRGRMGKPGHAGDYAGERPSGNRDFVLQ